MTDTQSIIIIGGSREIEQNALRGAFVHSRSPAGERANGQIGLLVVSANRQPMTPVAQAT